MKSYRQKKSIVERKGKNDMKRERKMKGKKIMEREVERKGKIDMKREKKMK